MKNTMGTRIIGGLNVHPSDGVHPEFPNKEYSQASFCFDCLCDNVCDKCMFCSVINKEAFDKFNFEMTDTECQTHIYNEKIQRVKTKVQELIAEAYKLGLIINIVDNEAQFNIK